MPCCRTTWPLVIAGLVGLFFVACDQRSGNREASSVPPPSGKPVSHQLPAHVTSEKDHAKKTQAATDTHSAKAPLEGEPLLLTGLSMTVPRGWMREQVSPGPMKPVAVFKIPPAQGDTEPASVRFTYFPKMKGMDQANIDRWIRQVRQPNGQPSTRDNASVDVMDLGSVRVTKVDIVGVVDSSMASMGSAAGAHPNQRMIAAIVDHPRGPHFVRIQGGKATIGKWAESINQFLASAKVR